MKKKISVTEFDVVINNNLYTVDIRKDEIKNTMSNSIKYSVMTFEADMTPFKRFTLVYNYQDKNYWAWTGDCIREEDRLFREELAQLLNDGVVKLVA